MLKNFGFWYALDKFAFNQLVYLENYQSLSYGKQKVKTIINDHIHNPGNRCLCSDGQWI